MFVDERASCGACRNLQAADPTLTSLELTTVSNPNKKEKPNETAAKLEPGSRNQNEDSIQTKVEV